MSHMSSGPVAVEKQAPPPLTLTDSDNATVYGDDHLMNGKFDPSHPLYQDLAPEDSYSNGVYWADLPRGERTKWINAQSNAEAKRELKHLGAMIKRDPLSPVSAYFGRYVIGGFGLFTEGYTLFSIGNLSTLYASVWPTCWGTYKVCSENLVASVTYLQILGIMVGQVMVGFEGDWVGRRFGLVQDALVMFVGLIMLTASWGTTLNGWVACYAVSQFVYGVGVGGEYPMTSTTALETPTTGGMAQRDDKLHRGRNVVLAFLMQGWGQLFNQAILIILLLIFSGGGAPPYSKQSAQWTYRISFAVVAVATLWLAYYRYYKKAYSSTALARSKKNARVNQSGYDSAALKLTISHFGGRVIGTTMGWFMNDFLFYGNKLFQGTFLKVIQPSATHNVVVGWNWNLVNIGVSLVGYYLSAILIDHKSLGRRRLQILGFAMDGALFLIGAIWFHQLSAKAHIHGFQVIYYFSSFFQQFGPNCTTFLVAAEVYPISVRATAHGLSAASGKLGALVPAILYNYIDNRTKFWVVCWFGLAGAILTYVFIPDTTGLDLREQDRYWAYVREGRAQEYHGIAVHPRHLSVWEKVVLKRHLAYDQEKDRIARVGELREMHESRLRDVGKEGGSVDDFDGDDEVSQGAVSYFNSEKNTPRMKAQNPTIYE